MKSVGWRHTHKHFKGIVSRDLEGVLMIPIDGWQVCVVPLGGLKFLKCHFPLKFIKFIELAVLH
jgi:hypothetical protein